MPENKDDILYLKEELEKCRQDAENEKHIYQDFLSDISHELRTPVAVLRGSLEAICDGIIDDSEQLEEYHRQMLSESIYLQTLINDLLEFSRLQNSKYRINMEMTNVYDVISDVVRSIRKISEEKGVELNFEKTQQCYIINGDYSRLRQMFIVVLENAVKFTEKGGKIDVGYSVVNDRLKIHISDTGCGIKKDELENIFLKYYRSQSITNRSGTGLGLAIAKEIAQRHSIDINVESEYGKGSTFNFVFPKNQMNNDL